jgi:hypothetical protein
MSITELKKTADRLSARERQWLRSYLFASERSEAPEWKKRMLEKRQVMEAKGGFTKSGAKRAIRSES